MATNGIISEYGNKNSFFVLPKSISRIENWLVGIHFDNKVQQQMKYLVFRIFSDTKIVYVGLQSFSMLSEFSFHEVVMLS